MTRPPRTWPGIALQEPPGGCIALAEIEYLLDTGRIQYVVLAGVPMVSLEDVRDYLRRHDPAGEQVPARLQPALV